MPIESPDVVEALKPVSLMSSSKAIVAGRPRRAYVSSMTRLQPFLPNVQL